MTLNSSPTRPVVRGLAGLAGVLAVVLVLGVGCKRNQVPSPQANSNATQPAAAPSADSSTEQPKAEDKGSEPTIEVTGAFSRTQKLGDPIQVSGKLSNPNPFPISTIEVSFLHLDAGESQSATLFEGKPVPANATRTWKVSVTFDRGHLPEAFIATVEDWKKVQ